VAIAYYTVFSLLAVLLIVIAVAGLAFGADAARGALVDEISSLMGRQGSDAVQTMIALAKHKTGVAGQALVGWLRSLSWTAACLLRYRPR
jgi:membrane protein